MKQKRGDTLIEVALAIGIFSLVAIVIVSVVSASTSGAQSSLELTLTREELDSQAEALRFIHDSYVSGSQSKDTSENKYAELWNKITSYTISEPENKNDPSNVYAKGILNYNPETCSSVYNGTGSVNNLVDSGDNPTPFIINARNIGDISGADNDDDMVAAVNNVVITGNDGVFYAPTTYPRILYGNNAPGSTEGSDKSLQEQAEDSARKIQRVEGLYIIGIKGKSQIVDGGNTNPNNVSPKTAYYDFYIRSCWMPVGSDHASTISTVIRLYDPAVICYGNSCSGS